MHKVIIKNSPLKTPQGHPFYVPSLALLKAIQEEWEKDSSSHYRLKPLTSLAATALDKVEKEKEAYMAYILQALSQDVVLFWASSPEALMKLQEERWSPLIDRLNKTLALALKPSFTLSVPSLLIDEEEKIKNFLHSLSIFQLAGLAHLVSLLSSFCISFLVLLNQLPPEQAWDLAQLHEHYQQQVWGKDEETKTREKAIKEEVEVTAQFLKLVTLQPLDIA